MHPDIEKVLFTQEEIASRVRALGAQIAHDLAADRRTFSARSAQSACSGAAEEGAALNETPLLAVCTLKGAVPFFADLIRALPVPLETEYIALSSYGSGTNSSGQVRIGTDIRSDLRGRDVLVVEDIVDSGRTLYFLRQLLAARGPRSVRVCTLLDKPCRRAVPFTADYVGFAVEDVFVVGYGMDYAERYRNFPYIGVLKRSVCGG